MASTAQQPGASSADARLKEILAARQELDVAARQSEGNGVVNGVPGWAYYVTFGPQTPERVRIDLRRSGYALAGAEHKDVKVLSATGAESSIVELWAKPAALVQMDLEEERRRRPRPSSLSAPRFGGR